MQAQRRRKTLLACCKCRDRRTRCNGGRPFCQSCIDRGWQAQCNYDRASSKPNVVSSDSGRRPRNHERLQSLSSVTELQRGTATNLLTPQSDIIESEGVRFDAPVVLLSAHTTSDLNHSVDGVCQATSSIEGFMDEISRSALPPNDLGQNFLFESLKPYHSSADKIPDMSSRDRLRDDEPIFAVLPERDVADALIELFFHHLHPIFPILHLPTFKTAYQRLWSPNHSQSSRLSIDKHETATFHSTTNIVFALGCQYYEKLNVNSRILSADQFYQRSRSFFSIDALDNSSLATVQLLLLSAIYLHNTRYANRCWNMVGMAVRVAQGLDLHFESKARCYESQLVKEMSRRVWYNCVILDKLTATTFGRPTLLVKKITVKPPKPIDDVFLQLTSESCQQPPGVPAQIEGFIQTIKLFDVLDDVLSDLYSQDSSNSMYLSGSHTIKGSSPIMLKMSALNSRLDDFISSMPHSLRLGSQSANYVPEEFTGVESHRKWSFHLQARTLYCRCLYVRILILRPSLLARTQPDNEPYGKNQKPECWGLEESALSEMRKLCISSAKQVIETLYTQQENPESSASWHAVYFAFTSATILWAAAILSPSAVNLEAAPYKDLWEKATKVLQYNQVQLQASSHALEVLQSCRSKLKAFKDQGLPDASGITQSKPDTPFNQNSEFQQQDELQRESCWSLPPPSEVFDLTDPDLFAESWAFTEASSTYNWDYQPNVLADS